MTLGFRAPVSLQDLAACLSDAAIPTLIAGGTDMLIAPGQVPASGVLVDLGRIPELASIEMSAGTLTIGAALTASRLAVDPLVRRAAPALAQAADAFGSVQIRGRATIGGNIANGAAAADLAPALVAMQAEAGLLSPGGAAWVPVADLLASRPVLPARCALTAFRLPALPSAIGAFIKLGRRQEPTISKLTLAAAGPAGSLRLVAGALGPAPRRLMRAEAALNAGAAEFTDLLAREVLDAIPGRASAAYKARAIRALGLDLLARLTPAAGAPA